MVESGTASGLVSVAHADALLGAESTEIPDSMRSFEATVLIVVFRKCHLTVFSPWGAECSEKSG